MIVDFEHWAIKRSAILWFSGKILIFSNDTSIHTILYNMNSPKQNPDYPFHAQNSLILCSGQTLNDTFWQYFSLGRSGHRARTGILIIIILGAAA